MEINEYECLPKFELKLTFLENLRKPLTLKSARKRIDIDFERVSNVCALARLTKIENGVWFSSGGFSYCSYAIQEKFTRQAVNFSIVLKYNLSTLWTLMHAGASLQSTTPLSSYLVMHVVYSTF